MSDIYAWCYDSVNAREISGADTANVIMGYVDGRVSMWSESDWQRFPGHRIAKVTVTGKYQEAMIADIENGDLTPADAAEFVKNRNKFSGKNDATLYCSLSLVPEVVAEADKAGEPYWLFVAYYTDNKRPSGGFSIPTGRGRICAQQFADFGLYDQSAVYSNEWLGLLSRQPEASSHSESVPAPSSDTPVEATPETEPTQTVTVQGNEDAPTNPGMPETPTELDGYVVCVNPLGGFSGRAVKSVDNGASWQ